MQTLNRRQFFKISIGTVACAALAAWVQHPVLSLLGLDSEEWFTLPDRRADSETIEGWTSYQCIQALPHPQYDAIHLHTAVGETVTCWTRNGSATIEQDGLRWLNGQRLRVAEYPELARLVRLGHLRAIA